MNVGISIVRTARHPCLLLGLMMMGSVPYELINAQDSRSAFSAGVHELRPGEFGYTKLMAAALEGNKGEVEALLLDGADPDALDQLGRTALMNASASGHLEIVRLLLENGADANIRSEAGMTALGNAIDYGSAASVLALLEFDANPNVLMTSGRLSALEAAAGKGDLVIVDVLIEYGADIGLYGGSALRNAAWKGHSDIASTLVLAGADVNDGSPADGRSALYLASENGDLGTVKLLIANGARVDERDRHGLTPLCAAIRSGHAPVAHELMAAGALVTSSELSAALESSESGLTEALLERVDSRSLTEADLDKLMIAADKAGASDVVEALIGMDIPRAIGADSARLLFSRMDAGRCIVSVWDPRSGAENALIVIEESCPVSAYVAQGTLFFVEDGWVQGVSIVDGSTFSVDLPIQDIETRLASLTAEIQAWAKIDQMRMESVIVGYLDSGDLAVTIRSTDPADGNYSYLYGRFGESWAFIDEKRCRRFDSCLFPGAKSREIDDWQTRRSVWHPFIHANRYVVNREAEWLSTGAQEGKIHFEIDGQSSELSFLAVQSEHSEGILTTRIDLQVGNGEPIVLLDRYGDSELYGRHALVRQRDGGSLTFFDLGTGESLLGPLESATWVE